MTIFDEALRSGRPVGVPDVTHSLRFPPNARALAGYALSRGPTDPLRRIHVYGRLLDLRSQKVRPGLGVEVVGLQALADHLATALRQCELYGDAVPA